MHMYRHSGCCNYWIMDSRLKVFLTLLKYLRACLRYLMLSCQSLTTGLQPSGNHQLSSTLVLHWSYWLNPSVAHPATTSVATIYSVLTISSPGFDCKQLPAYILLFVSKHQLRQDVPKFSECPSTIACICLEMIISLISIWYACTCRCHSLFGPPQCWWEVSISPSVGCWNLQGGC